jgi:uncharacterized repeat protein (TIGR02543 family)
MNCFRRASCRVVSASFLLLTMFGFGAEAIGGQLTATWVESSTNQLGFSVERSTGTTGTFAEIATAAGNVTTYIDGAAADGTTYCYRVRAYNTSAWSDYSNVACALTAQAFSLAVVKMGAGSGTVIGSPSGIICGATCSGSYASGTSVMLQATPAAGSTFTGWSGGGCSGTGSCAVTLTSSTTVIATFDVSSSVALTVVTTGTGTGTVSSTPAGIMCGTTCSASYPSGTAVTLTAAVPSDSTFTGWSGACTGTGSCAVTLTAASTVTATFTASTSSLTAVTVSVSGKGTITSAPVGIQCGTTCSATYPSGTTVTLAAAAAQNFVFKGWTGDCTGTGACTVTLIHPATVSANFANAKKK